MDLYIGVGSGGARGRLAPPSFKLGGHRPPNFTHCLHNELHCSIVDRIACRHCSSRKSHFCCLEKMSPPQVRTSSYAYVLHEIHCSYSGNIAMCSWLDISIMSIPPFRYSAIPLFLPAPLGWQVCRTHAGPKLF